MTAEEYKRAADECRQFAERAISVAARIRWHQIAYGWMELAQKAEEAEKPYAEALMKAYS